MGNVLIDIYMKPNNGGLSEGSEMKKINWQHFFWRQFFSCKSPACLFVWSHKWFRVLCRTCSFRFCSILLAFLSILTQIGDRVSCYVELLSLSASKSWKGIFNSKIEREMKFAEMTLKCLSKLLRMISIASLCFSGALSYKLLLVWALNLWIQDWMFITVDFQIDECARWYRRASNVLNFYIC